MIRRRARGFYGPLPAIGFLGSTPSPTLFQKGCHVVPSTPHAHQTTAWHANPHPRSSTHAPVVCARCAQTFAKPAGREDEGHGCSSGQHNGMVVGHYGSVRHDSRRYLITDPQRVPSGLLCDGCIDVLLVCGALAPDTHVHQPGNPWLDSLSPEDKQQFLDMMHEAFDAL